MFFKICTLLLVTSPAPQDQPTGKRVIVDQIAAVIENEIITVRELEAKAQPYMNQLDEISDPKAKQQKRSQILRQVLDIEIDEKIVGGEIARSKDRLGVTDKDVDRAVEEVLRMNNLTQDQLQAALYSQGLTWVEYRKKLYAQIERARLIQFQVQGKVQIKDEDVQRRCRERHRSGAKDIQVCATHILRQIPNGASAEEVERLKMKMSELQSQLSAGADFSAFALKYSDDKAAPDGDIGCFGHGEMVEEFEKVAFAMAVGDVSAVVRSPFGFHIIKVIDRRLPSTGQCSDEEELNTFRNEIYQEQLDSQMKIWLKELRNKAFVEVRL